jgi:hypothetical protein
MVTQEVGDREGAPAPELRVAGRRLDRELTGEPLVIGGRSIQPLAQMRGLYGSDAQAQAGLAWALVRLKPNGVQVREADGEETFVSIEDPTAEGLRGIFLAGLLVAVVCWVVMLVGRRKRAPLNHEGTKRKSLGTTEAPGHQES